MKNNFYYKFKSLFCLIGFLLFSTSALATTWVVDILNDEVDGTNNCTPGDCSLREAVLAAVSGDTITFAIDGTFYLTRTTGLYSTGDLDIGKNLTIIGNGQSRTIIDGSDSAHNRLFIITGNVTLNLQDMTLQKGDPTQLGGAILVSGSASTTPTLNLTRVTLANNTSSLAGGGVACQISGNVTVTSSIFSGNQAGTSGGAISMSSCDSLTVSLTDMSTNTAVSSGGGISNSGDGGTGTAISNATISQSLFYNNSAGSTGGAIYNTANLGLSLTNSSVITNTAGNGGGVYNNAYSLSTIQNDTIYGNSSTASLSNGGGIYNNNHSSSVIKNTIVYSNTSAISSTYDCYNITSSITSYGYNVIPTSTCSYTVAEKDITSGDGLSLNALADNGGATRTMSIPVTSSAHNTGSCTLIGGSTNTVDQRGKTRSSTCDMGAYEYLATWYFDSEGDGYAGSTTTTEADSQPSGYYATADDCDDTLATIHPGATETCNGVDDDCNGIIDDNAQGGTTYYRDLDGDGYGATAVVLCSLQTGYVTVNGDCNDTNSAISPAATETCDGVDNNCDGTVDEGAPANASTWYADADSDGYGNLAVTQLACSAPSGYVANATDCNDSSGAVHPNATESCNNIDDDCDGSTDESGATGETTYYRDVDGDSYGEAGNSRSACSQPSGYALVSGDCNDANANVNPAGSETCNGVDDNCNGAVDDNASGSLTWYADADGDTFGDAGVTTSSCTQPSGYVSNHTDCNDASSAIKPTATEVCDSVDNNCNGTVDESTAADAATWYADSDGDTFGDPLNSVKACTQPSGYIADHTDCNDSSSAIKPTAIEVCDGADNNCNGTIDESSAADATTWYADSDGDAFGNASSSTIACNQPVGYVADHTDCNDSLAAVNPLATETCSTNYDDNCNGQINESGSAGETLFYRDNDNDGYGDTFTFISSCTAPVHYIVDNTDCDDTSALYHPGATEICDNHDNNCDGTVDEATAADATTWYTDADGDTFGNEATAQVACNQPVGTVAIKGDCNDARADVNPAAHESCTATEDLNCDGSVGDADADGDGYRACEDCNDANAAINIAATETCDGVDNNCDGTVDETTSADAAIWYADADGDAFGNALVTTPACSKPTGFVADNTDCDDTSGAVKPGAVESCDGIDNNCDGDVDPSTSIDAIVFYQDADSDGHGSEIISTNACSQPNGYVVNHDDCNDSSAAFNPSVADICGDHTDNNCDGVINPFDNDADGYSSCEGDCDDTNAAVHPTATELCDSIDNNCDGTVDEATSADASTWYADTDSDTFGDTNSSIQACNQPSGYVADNTDCDDTNGAVHPNAAEVCANGVNDDCDSATPDGTTITWYQDTDGDTFGNPLVTQQACGTPTGYVADNTDCDDTRIDVYPHAIENCNERDDDCDGQIDEDLISTFYQDSDGDGLGDPDTSMQACLLPAGYATNKTDCDDTKASVGVTCPGATTDKPDTDSGSSGGGKKDDTDATKDDTKDNNGTPAVRGGSGGCSLHQTKADISVHLLLALGVYLIYYSYRIKTLHITSKEKNYETPMDC